MRVEWEGMGMQSIQCSVSCQIQLLVTHARFTMSQQCHVTSTTSESAALSSLSPPVCPPPSSPTSARVFDVRTWHRSHQAAKFSPPHVCVTSMHDVRSVAVFFVASTRCSGTQALYPAVLPSRPVSHNILRFDQPMDTSQTSQAKR